MEEKIEDQNTVEIVRQYAGLFLRWSWLLVLIAGMAAFIGYIYSARETPMYRTSTIVMIKTGQVSQFDYYSSLYYGKQLIDTYARVMTTQSVLEELSNMLGYEVTPSMFSVKPIEETQLMSITVTDSNPARAALIANTIVGVFMRQIQADQNDYYIEGKQNLQEQLSETRGQITNITEELTNLGTDPQYDIRRNQLQNNLDRYQSTEYYLLQSIQQMGQAQINSSFNIIQKDPAQIPNKPFSPQPMRTATTAGIIGFFTAAAIILIIEFLNDSIRDPQEITRKWGLPIMGTIASFDSDENSLITIKQPRSPVSEAFRALRTNLLFFSIDHPLRTIQITSASPSDGKTTVAVNLACVIAQSNQPVVIVDADLRRPKVHKMLGVSNRAGLTDQFIHGEEYFLKSIKPSGITDLSVLPSGNLPPNPSELLSTEKMQDILTQLESRYKTVIIDTPPILAVSDATILAARVDGVLLVVKPSITKRNELTHAIEQLKKVNANLLGVVVNDVKMKHSGVYYRNYYGSGDKEVDEKVTAEKEMAVSIPKPTGIGDDAT